tara:strand:+ start:354 stop:848 length:495 start_codon:yes stop_codon:yes gene_type:complete
MPKKIDREQELKFIDYYTEGDTAGNASKSAEKAGWKEDPRQMGYYLKNKYIAEIKQKHDERIAGTSGLAISVLQNLLHSEQDSVKLNTAKLVLELGGFSSQNINLNVENGQNKTDAELLEELQGLVSKIPALKPKLAMIQDNTEEENNETSDNEPKRDENRLTH